MLKSQDHVGYMLNQGIMGPWGIERKRKRERAGERERERDTYIYIYIYTHIYIYICIGLRVFAPANSHGTPCKLLMIYDIT